MKLLIMVENGHHLGAVIGNRPHGQTANPLPLSDAG